MSHELRHALNGRTVSFLPIAVKLSGTHTGFGFNAGHQLESRGALGMHHYFFRNKEGGSGEVSELALVGANDLHVARLVKSLADFLEIVEPEFSQAVVFRRGRKSGHGVADGMRLDVLAQVAHELGNALDGRGVDFFPIAVKVGWTHAGLAFDTDYQLD